MQEDARVKTLVRSAVLGTGDAAIGGLAGKLLKKRNGQSQSRAGQVAAIGGALGTGVKTITAFLQNPGTVCIAVLLYRKGN